MSGEALGFRTGVSAIREGYQALADLKDARFKHGGGVIDWSQVDPVGGRNTILTLTIDATGATFTLTYGAQTTGAIAENATAATVEEALEGLSTIGNGNVQVSGSAGGPYTIEFVEDLRHTATTPLTANGASLTGGAGTATVTTVQAGAADADLTLPSGRVVKIGDKVVQAGTVMIRNGSDLFEPADDSSTLTRGDCYVQNVDRVYSDPGSGQAALFDGGTVWFSRLKIGGGGQPSVNAFLAAFPGINLIRD